VCITGVPMDTDLAQLHTIANKLANADNEVMLVEHLATSGEMACPTCLLPAAGAAHIGVCAPPVPINWPAGVIYTSAIITPGIQAVPMVPIPGVKICVISEPYDHPCLGERGLFATTKLAIDITLGQYTGILVPKAGFNPSRYVAEIPGASDVDALQAGNEFRFINHFMGTGPRIII